MLSVKSYYIPDKATFEITLPKDARFLTVAQLTEVPELIFLINTDAPVEIRYFIKTGLGFKLDYDKEKLVYLGIFAMRYKHQLIFEVLNVSVQSSKLQTQA